MIYDEFFKNWECFLLKVFINKISFKWSKSWYKKSNRQWHFSVLHDMHPCTILITLQHGSNCTCLFCIVPVLSMHWHAWACNLLHVSLVLTWYILVHDNWHAWSSNSCIMAWYIHIILISIWIIPNEKARVFGLTVLQQMRDCSSEVPIWLMRHHIIMMISIILLRNVDVGLLHCKMLSTLFRICEFDKLYAKVMPHRIYAWWIKMTWDP